MKTRHNRMDLGALLEKIEDCAETITDVYTPESYAGMLGTRIRRYAAEISNRQALRDVMNRRD